MTIPTRTGPLCLVASAALAATAGCGAVPADPHGAPPAHAPPVHEAGAPHALVAGPAIQSPAGPYRCEGHAVAAGGRSYCVYRAGTTWQEAEQQCLATGAHLAAIGDAKENKALYEALGSTLGSIFSVWIGLSERAEDRWVLADGALPHFGNWAPQEPNNAGGNEGCAEWYTTDGKWNDVDCNSLRGYLCERAPNADPGMSCTGIHLTIGGSAYCVYKDSVRTWAAAQAACQATGGTLALITSLAENQALYEVLTPRLGTPTAWIGFTDHGHEGTWTWTSGEPATFQAFRAGEPNNYGGEDCAEWIAADGGWNDFQCSAKRWSICEAPAGVAAVARPP